MGISASGPAFFTRTESNDRNALIIADTLMIMQKKGLKIDEDYINSLPHWRKLYNESSSIHVLKYLNGKTVSSSPRVLMPGRNVGQLAGIELDVDKITKAFVREILLYFDKLPPNTTIIPREI